MKLKEQIELIADQVFKKHGCDWRSVVGSNCDPTNEEYRALCELSNLSAITEIEFLGAYLGIKKSLVQNARRRVSMGLIKKRFIKNKAA